MLDANVPLVLERIGPDDRVLDVGGWARCFNRADWVIDMFPYATRGQHYAQALGLTAQGGPAERFSAETWVEWDLCQREPWPFPDGMFDFCTCSHTIEDLRDPIWVCQEMMRVAKRGYLEVPSQAFEMSRGREAGVPVGLSHHRWICIRTGTGFEFAPKNHYIHGDRQLSLSAAHAGRMSPEEQVSWLFWDGEFSVREAWLSRDDMAAFVRQHEPDAPEAHTGASAPEVESLRLELDRSQTMLGLSQWEHEQTKRQLDDTRRHCDAIEQQRFEQTEGLKFELAHLKWLQAQTEYERNVARAEVQELQQELARLRDRAATLQVRVDQVHGLGDRSLTLARRAQRIGSAARRILPG